MALVAGKYSSLGPETQLRSTTLRTGDSGVLGGLSGLGVGALTNTFSQVFARYPEAAGTPPSSGRGHRCSTLSTLKQFSVRVTLAGNPEI